MNTLESAATSLRRFGMTQETLANFYRCVVESVLIGCITVWYGDTNTPERKALQKIEVTSRPSTAKDVKALLKPVEKVRSRTPSKSARKVKSAEFTEGVVPLFLTSKTQEIFHCVIDHDVTQEKPCKLIKKEFIIDDMKSRAAVSDFHPYKRPIMDYQGEELLIVYDVNSKYEQNFYMTLNEMMKVIILQSFQITPSQKEAKVTEGIVETERRIWIDLGSGSEIEQEKFEEPATKIKFKISRLRRRFGAPVTFDDRNDAETKDSYVECASYQDKSFSIRTLERSVGVQAVSMLQEDSTQTEWTYPRNACTQYTPREFTAEEKQELMKSETLANFINSVALRFESALQQNEIMDVFYDDWKGLSEDDGTFGGKTDSHLKEYQSFTDMQKSQGKRISHIEWHPVIQGLVAVSVVDVITVEGRVNSTSRMLHSHSYILFWNFSDPIHPQIMLEAPDDIYSFQFCPTDPNVVAGSCLNGQVVLWDINEFVERLQGHPAAIESDAHKSNLLPELDTAPSFKVPTARHCAVSSIENGHKSMITDLCWLPDHFELTKFGIPCENADGMCVQLVTCSPDCTVLFWDIRHPKSLALSMQDKRKIEKELQNPEGVPSTFKHLDLHWKPMHKVALPKIEGSGEYSPMRMSMREKCTDRVNEKVQLHLLKGNGENTEYSAKDVPSTRNLTNLTDINTSLFIGTEDGEIIYVNWQVEKDMDTGKMTTPKPTHCYLVHDGPVNTMQRSPFFHDIILTLGGWTIAIWKEGVTLGPLLQSACTAKRCTTGHWSLTRPGVFIVGKEDGNIDIWDLLEKTHEPSQTQNISSVPISCIKPCIVSQKQHLLAVSDDFGTLHILEVPWSLRYPFNQERSTVEGYFEREVKRLDYFETKKIRRAETKEKEGHRSQEPPVIEAKNTEQMEEEMRKEYSVYLMDEKKAIFAQLGKS